MKKIIIIDDDLMSLKSLNRLLTEWDFKTEIYQSVDDITFNTSLNSYCCAIVDYKLPEYDGMKVLDVLRNQNINLIPILISGFEIDFESIKEIESKCIYFLKKPLDIRRLKQIINQKMEKK